LTICNLSIELGAKMGMVAPGREDLRIFARARLCTARRDVGAGHQCLASASSDPDAVFDEEVVIDVAKIIPQVTWGISPEHVIGVDGRIPDPASDRRSGAPRRG